MKHPVVIVGAGYCGVVSLKICLENGLDAVCFDKTDNFGGLWRFRDGDYNGVASVQRTTIINTSKEMNALSDFPPPADYANYMHNSNMLAYLEKYIEHFRLAPHIHFRKEVMMVEKSGDYEANGEWRVRIKDEQGQESEMLASGVFVCIGHHVFPNVPQFQGQALFRGTIKHSHSYKHFEGLEKKRVLVVGVGNSGMDVAVDSSHVAKQVYLSTRRGAWVVGRVNETGLPFDFTITRFSALLHHYFPNLMLNQTEKQVNKVFDHELYNMKPRHRYNAQHPTISDALPERILSGAIVVKGDILRFTEKGVIFKGEEDEECEVDAVVFATGYDIVFPFLGDVLPSTSGNKIQLYQRVFPPQLRHPTLAIIGLIQPIGPIFPVAEIQARWVCQLLKKEKQLPPIDERMREVAAYEHQLRNRYVASQRHTIQVDLVPYMDGIATLAGCKPDLTKIFFTDPALFKQLMFGPSVSYQYRLTGPHSWDGARDAIMTVTKRMKKPLSTRHGDNHGDIFNMPNPIIGVTARLSTVFILLALLVWFFT